MIVKVETTTQILARFACELTSDDVSPFALEMAKRAIMDLLAAAIAGRETLPALAVTASAETIFAKGTASLWFSDKTLTTPGAAYGQQYSGKCPGP